MNNRVERARETLGLAADADAQSIEGAVADRRAALEKKRGQAPTDALREKIDRALKQLDEARDLLLAEASGDASAVPSDSGSSAPSRGASSLSETKMADLPSTRPSATRIGDDTAGAAVDLQVGDVLAERYEIVERIGAGGMGSVFRARDRNRDEDIALKVLLPSLTTNERARERFLDEARLSSKLSHPGIVNVYDVQNDGELYFLTMELLEGQDLRQVMENRKLARQPFSEKDLKELGQSLCEVLAYAHRHTIHRDIKPENIWLTEDGEYKLMDFGIARLQSASQRTQTSAVMGTAYYMAPEQLKGAKDIDGRADQYAMAVLLYELATGDVPAGVIKPLREQRSDLSKGFCEAVMRALSADPDERFADMEAFAGALARKGSGGVSISAALPGRKAVLALAAVVVLVLGGVGLIGASGAGGVGAMLADLLPMSAEERRALQADAVRLQGQVNTLARRLENARRNLDSDLRDAERNDSDELRALQRWSEVTERNLFSGSLMSDLEGERGVGEALLRDREYEPAIESFAKARDGYEAVLENFAAGEDVFRMQERAHQVRQDYLALQQETGYGHPEAARKGEEFYETAGDHENAGELAPAVQGWSDAEAALREAIDLIERTHSVAGEALARRDEWARIQKEYGVSAETLQQSAETAMTKARGHEQEGSLEIASEQWDLAEAQWQEALDSVSEQMQAIDAERERQERIEAEKKARIAAEKRAEQERLAAERRAEEERIAAEKRAEEERKFVQLRSEILQFVNGASGTFEEKDTDANHEKVVIENNLENPDECTLVIDSRWTKIQRYDSFIRTSKYTHSGEVNMALVSEALVQNMWDEVEVVFPGRSFIQTKEHFHASNDDPLSYVKRGQDRFGFHAEKELSHAQRSRLNDYFKTWIQHCRSY